MGVLADHQIEALCIDPTTGRPLPHPMIVPYSTGEKRPGRISYGQDHYGYCPRIGYVFDIFDPNTGRGGVIDPKDFDKTLLRRVDLTPRSHNWVKLRDQGMRSPPKWACQRCAGVGQVTEYEGAELPDSVNHTACSSIAQPPDHIVIPGHGFALAETVEWYNVPRDILVVCLGKSTYARCGLVLNVTPGEPEWSGRWTMELSNTSSVPIKVYANEGIMQTVFLTADQMCETSYKDKAGKYQGQTGLTNPTVDGEADGADWKA